jgi:hypothetical protein
LRLGDLEINLERRDTISGMDSFSCIIGIICVMRVMSPPIMSQPFISPPIMGVVWADAVNDANAIVATMERADKGRET